LDLTDRTAAAESIIAAEERERSPVWKAVELAVDLFPTPVRAALGAFGGLQVPRLQNLEYLHQALRDDLRDLAGRIDKLDEAHRRFCEQHLIGLVVDAHFKVEALRSKTKIKRIARILVSTWNEDPCVSPDYAEEMMRVAAALDDADVQVLGQIVAAQKRYLGREGCPDLNAANEAWKSSPPTIKGVTTAGVTSICLKLESFGLITRVERIPTMFGLETAGLPFGLLSKGSDFVRFALREGEGGVV
jgi:hypothetical protein